MTQFKTVLKMVGPKLVDLEQCKAQVAGISSIPGYVSSYIDVKNKRVVSFHEVDNKNDSSLQPGQSWALVEDK